MPITKSRKLLIVGLGNPGTEYTNTRHNAGFMALDYLAPPDAKWKKEKNYLVHKMDVPPEHKLFSFILHPSSLILLKPTTYMNLSGAAVLAAMQKYKIPLGDVIVIHDELDLPLGEVRTKTGGGNAGHNGLKSISAAVGNDYRRVRIGIGRPEDKEIDTSAWVLGRFTQTELSSFHITVKDKLSDGRY